MAQQKIFKIQTSWSTASQRISERMVGGSQKAIKSALASRRLTLPVLTTTLCQFERTLNARPITAASDDQQVLEALTPSYLSLGRAVVLEPLTPDASRYVDCRRLYKLTQAYNAMIWKRWSPECLPRQWTT